MYDRDPRRGQGDRELPFPCMESKLSGHVLATLKGKVLRFSQIRCRLPGISPKTLSAVLKQFDRDGLVERRQYAVIPPRVEYELTQLGNCLGDLLSLVKDLSEQSRPQIQASRTRFAERATAASIFRAAPSPIFTQSRM
jgi:DNA-binding HxlR family transcriptional regulator